MTIDILMPALSPTMTEGTLAKWLVKEGDQVQVKVIKIDRTLDPPRIGLGMKQCVADPYQAEAAPMTRSRAMIVMRTLGRMCSRLRIQEAYATNRMPRGLLTL
ncbi:MAG: hypothetical protein IH924_06010 [Proteobacteria bacterium]|nr:hypothetical protein [Pseudomonadota bacterium]